MTLRAEAIGSLLSAANDEQFMADSSRLYLEATPAIAKAQRKQQELKLAALAAARHATALLSSPTMRHNAPMTEPLTRPELDAKLEAIEARMDGRLARIEDAVKRISEENAATRTGITNLKTAMVVTAVGAVLTVLFGVAAFNATLLSNMAASFDSGRETAKLAAEAKTAAAQTQEQTARLIADAEVKSARAQADTAEALAEIRKIVSGLNKNQQ